jgi:hypothetical protein
MAQLLAKHPVKLLQQACHAVIGIDNNINNINNMNNMNLVDVGYNTLIIAIVKLVDGLVDQTDQTDQTDRARLLELACEALASMAKRADTRQMCAQAGATQTVLKVVQSCKQHDSVLLELACSALANLVPNDSHACHAYDIELIADLIGQNMAPNWTLWHACRALAGLANMLDKPTRILVCHKACAVEALVEILDQCDDTWLLAEACRVLAFLLQDNHVGHDTVECIYEVIMELFDRHDDDDLMQQVCALLGVLDVDRETDYVFVMLGMQAHTIWLDRCWNALVGMVDLVEQPRAALPPNIHTSSTTRRCTVPSCWTCRC